MPIGVGPDTEVYQFQEAGSNVDFVTALTVGANPHVVISTTTGQNENQIPKGEFVTWIAGTGLSESAGTLVYDLAELTPESVLQGTDLLLMERAGGHFSTTPADVQGFLEGVTVWISTGMLKDDAVTSAKLNQEAATDLAGTTDPSTFTIDPTNGTKSGTGVVIPAADGVVAGVVSAAKFADWEAGSATNLGTQFNPTQLVIINDSGTDATLVEATGLSSGIVTASNHTNWENARTVNLSESVLANSITIAANNGGPGGTIATLPEASGFSIGLMSSTDKNKIDGGGGWVDTAWLADGSVTLAKLDSSAQTTISVSVTATTADLSSSTGGGDSIPAATTSTAGVMTAADKAIVDGFGSAYAEYLNQSGSFLIDATDAVRIKITLNGNATPSITLPSETTAILFEINPGSFTFDWSSMSIAAGHAPPVLLGAQVNMVMMATDGTNLFNLNGTGQ